MKIKDVNSILSFQNNQNSWNQLLLKVINSNVPINQLNNCNNEEKIFGGYFGTVNRFELALAIRSVGSQYPIELLYSSVLLILNKITENRSDVLFYRNLINEFSTLCKIVDLEASIDINHIDITEEYKKHIIEVVEAADFLLKAIKHFKLEEVYEMKPKLSGNDIISVSFHLIYFIYIFI